MTGDRLVVVPGTLAEQVHALWRQQLSEWPRLAAGAASLRQARVKRIGRGLGEIVVQSNPSRLASTSAKVDADTLAARPCFLCAANLPPEQKAIAYGSRWWIVCNPAPIVEPHFTVPLIAHEPQRIRPAIEDMLNLARNLGSEFSLFYNGPRCGASAPDHLHMQAVPSAATPWERELLSMIRQERAEADGLLLFRRSGTVMVGFTRPPYRHVIVLGSPDPVALTARFEETLQILTAIRPAEPEPMLNLFVTWQDGGWILYFFPRAAHRPAKYGDGADEFLVSPGSLDLGGILIAPRGADFDRLTEVTAAAILDEVLLSPDEFTRLCDAIAS